MQASVLADNSTTVDAHNLPVRKSLTDDSQSLLVEVGLGIGGYQYGTIDDQIVGIGGWQTFLTIIDWAGQGES